MYKRIISLLRGSRNLSPRGSYSERTSNPNHVYVDPTEQRLVNGSELADPFSCLAGYSIPSQSKQINQPKLRSYVGIAIASLILVAEPYSETAAFKPSNNIVKPTIDSILMSNSDKPELKTFVEL